ncbi:mitochondrial dicarboxylate carrier [Drosophila mauritiana]|uniref:Mitochondrial dicarboxylate carrier n=1 Tax=Drosophila mauritiana TaxID=7226 RepID=A0A6P8K655_DROMA|nr:mitochondrial dicarboxylate carrier [Drosophila mauritiana]XP_033164319.1 mitochondrial dicarboxylate carrier [Drosophila mauritiana]
MSIRRGGLMSYNQRRIARWYFGGLASSMAAMVTHPIDLIKVLIQTQAEKLSVFQTTRKIVKEQGPMAMYNGISASMLRQYTYTLARFGIYSVGSGAMDTSTMTGKTCLAAIAGGIGGFVGAPADLINVRLQNDVKLPPEKRRNYKHAIDGLVRITRDEGWKNLFNGASMIALRGAFMTVGQIAFYEQSKSQMIKLGMPENMGTYILASMISSVVATTLTQPIDVVKTRRMNAAPGEYSGLGDVFVKTSKEGPLAFFKGYVPSLSRLLPHTVLLFLGLEYLRTHFGYLPEPKQTGAFYRYDDVDD